MEPVVDKPFPAIPADLLAELDRMFPERCPDLKQTDREIWRDVGAREVIRMLHAKFDEQNETVIQR
jgi:hypothetical protein